MVSDLDSAQQPVLGFDFESAGPPSSNLCVLAAEHLRMRVWLWFSILTERTSL